MGPGSAVSVGYLFGRLEVIDDPQPRPAPFNMAADEVLLEELGDSAVLRIYRWVQPSISFGYFTPLNDVALPRDNREPVRRWTGGGIVEHGADFTYSLMIPRRELASIGAPGRSYERIHHALAQALAGAGIAAVPIGPGMSEEYAAPGSHCFEHPVPHDLMIAGCKTAGGAQRRTRRGLLHQGSVQGVGDDGPPDWQERLARSLPEAFCASPVHRRFDAAKERSAKRLAEEKYATQAWLRRF
jgi:lipoate-protein ligase A